MEENKEKTTKHNKSKEILVGLSYIVETKEQKNKRQEQERTKVKKKIFLEYFEKSSGIVTVACQKAEIDRGRYYVWMKEDPEFKDNVENVNFQRNDVVEDRLFKKISQDDSSSIKFYLERRHPLYKPKNTTEVITGNKTLEDLIDEDEDKLNQEDGKKEKDKQVADRKAIEDKKQERDSSAVQTEHSTEPVLGEKDEKKPDNQSPAKGD